MMVQLSAPTDILRKAYRQLVADIDAMMAKLVKQRFQNVLKCSPGCTDCCMQFSVLPLEAAMIREVLAVSQLPETFGEKCALLLGDLCQIYEIRPVICRTQGMPLGYVDESVGTIEVSACLFNFPDDYPLSHEDLLYMDQFNGRLAELNLQYCQESGIDYEMRIPLVELVNGL